MGLKATSFKVTVSRRVPLSTWPPVAQAAQSRPSHGGYQARAQHDSPPRAGPPHGRACSPSMPAHCTPAYVHTCLHTGPGAARVWGSRTHFPRPLASWLHAAHVLESSWARFTLARCSAAHPAHVSLPQVCACPHLVYTVHTCSVYRCACPTV